MAASVDRFFKEDLKAAADEMRVKTPGLVEVTAAALAAHMDTDADVMASIFSDHPELVKKYINPPADASAGETAKADRNSNTRPKPQARQEKEPKMPGNGPSTTVVANRIGKLDPRLRAVIEALKEFGFRGYDSVAEKLNVEKVDVKKLVQEVFEALKIDEIDGIKEKRELLLAAWDQHAGVPSSEAPSRPTSRGGQNREKLPAVVADAAPSSVTFTPFGNGPTVLAVSPDVLRAGLEAGGLLFLSAANESGVRHGQVVLLTAPEEQ